ncbi:anthranilate phosphoribosyltransferase [Thioalkalivibrio sp. HK1]|uniref:anthranilate phosphoribosyltransferase n=1 Tax=Thioalkalivibrio sp. HK1 TaxID=1469245 RepID=UPI0018CC3BFE|nr:anthranilate phosphoribosyltransferase [Thioalkalivibrio sp. HK1]
MHADSNEPRPSSATKDSPSQPPSIAPEKNSDAERAAKRQLMRSIIQRIATGPELSRDIDRSEARRGMEMILDGTIDPVQAAVFLIALRMKRESDDENLGILDALIERSKRIVAPVDEVVDLSDPFNGFNRTLPVSAFVPALLAACGLPTISQGVESMGPKFGATHHRVLAACKIRTDLSPEEVGERLGNPQQGWAYCDQSVFNPDLHALTALRTLIIKRPALTTVEVMTGPVRGRRCTHIVTGYVHKPYARIYALLAKSAGFDSALIVRGTEGGIVPSLRQGTRILSYGAAEALGETEEESDISPPEVGIEQDMRAVPLPPDIKGYRRRNDDIQIDGLAIAQAAAKAGLEALCGAPGAARDSLVYASALILRHTGKVRDLAQGADLARKSIDQGRALERFRS